MRFCILTNLMTTEIKKKPQKHLNDNASGTILCLCHLEHEEGEKKLKKLKKKCEYRRHVHLHFNTSGQCYFTIHSLVNSKVVSMVAVVIIPSEVRTLQLG